MGRMQWRCPAEGDGEKILFLEVDGRWQPYHATTLGQTLERIGKQREIYGTRYSKGWHCFQALHKQGWALEYSEQGYTDFFYQEFQWWAFPPNGVMPVALPSPYCYPHPEDVPRSPVVRFVLPSSAQDAANAFVTRTAEARYRIIDGLIIGASVVRAEPSDTTSRGDTRVLGMDDLRAAAEMLRRHNVPPFPPSYPHYPGGYYEVHFARPVSEELRHELADSLASGGGLDDAIEYLCKAYRLTRPIALLRFREFCKQNKITEEVLTTLINKRQVQVKHGVICLKHGVKLRKNDDTPSG